MIWGEKLRKRREELGYTLQMAEEQTKIRKLYLQALENEDFAVLPPRIYATGFVKNYARFLGLDEKQLTQEFKELAYANQEVHDEEIVTYTPEKSAVPDWLNAKNIAAAVVFLLIAIWAGNYLVSYFSGQNIVEQPIVKPPIVEPQEPAGGEEPQQPDNIPAVPDKVDVLVSASQECWLEVSIDGTNNFTGFIKAGEEKSFTGEESVYLKAGNAGGIEIILNGENLGVFGDVGQVKRQTFTL
jgi:cytoskeleton protein RodZ